MPGGEDRYEPKAQAIFPCSDRTGALSHFLRFHWAILTYPKTGKPGRRDAAPRK